MNERGSENIICHFHIVSHFLQTNHNASNQFYQPYMSTIQLVLNHNYISWCRKHHLSIKIFFIQMYSLKEKQIGNTPIYSTNYETDWFCNLCTHHAHNLGSSLFNIITESHLFSCFTNKQISRLNESRNSSSDCPEW